MCSAQLSKESHEQNITDFDNGQVLHYAVSINWIYFYPFIYPFQLFLHDTVFYSETRKPLKILGFLNRMKQHFTRLFQFKSGCHLQKETPAYGWCFFLGSGGQGPPPPSGDFNARGRQSRPCAIRRRPWPRRIYGALAPPARRPVSPSGWRLHPFYQHRTKKIPRAATVLGIFLAKNCF